MEDMTASSSSSSLGSGVGNRQVMQLNYTEIKRVAEEKGLAIVDVPMDGDCALHAIVKQLQQQGCYSYDVRMLRAQATKQLESLPQLVNFTMLSECYSGDIKAYLSQQAVPGTLCDEAMLHAVAILIEGSIRVFDDNGFVTTFEPRTAYSWKLITIGRIGGVHYVSLEARDDAPSIKDPNRAHDYQTTSTASAARDDRLKTPQRYQEPQESREAVSRSSYSSLKSEAEQRRLSVDDDVPKTGDSALHAVVKQLHLQGIRLYDVTTLRKRAVDYLYSHKHLIDKHLSKAQSYPSAQSSSEIPCDWTMLSAVSEVITKEIHILHDDGHLERLQPQTSYTKPVVIGVYAEVYYVSLVEPPGSKHKYQTTSHVDTESRDDRCPETAIQHATPSATDGVGSDKSPNSTCAICMDVITDPKTLSCKHVFCSECIDQSLAYQPKCPSCGKIFGVLKGDQPTGGTMHVKRDRWLDLEGYPRCGRIVIDYYIPDGRQKV